MSDISNERPCPKCDGTGKVNATALGGGAIKVLCGRCGGSGEVPT